MKKEYDFSKMKSIKNPYVKLLKKQITIKITPTAIDYFKNLSKEYSISYQNLINLYLIDCASKNRKININWK